LVIYILSRFEVSTADAYSAVTPSAERESLIDISFMKISGWKENLVNDFESQIFKKFPVIAEIKQKVYESGAVYSSMSGSGSTVYGLYSEKPSLSEDLSKLRFGKKGCRLDYHLNLPHHLAIQDRQ